VFYFWLEHSLLHKWQSFSLATLPPKVYYAEFEIYVASYWRLLVNITHVASNLELIMVSINVNMFYFTLILK